MTSRLARPDSPRRLKRVGGPQRRTPCYLRRVGGHRTGHHAGGKKNFFCSDKNVPSPSAALQARAQAKANPRNFTEHHGVGFVIGPKFRNYVSDCTPHNGRIIKLHIRNQGPNIRIINHYAPHSARPFAEKDHQWNLLHSITDTQTANMPTFVVGDTNARLHGRVSGLEETIVGSHVFGWGNFFVDYLSDEQRENRQFLIDFCTANEFIVSNTFFIKPDECKCTCKGTRTNGFVGPWTPDRFAQIDLILASKQWRCDFRRARPYEYCL